MLESRGWSWNAGMCLELGMASTDRDGERAGCPPLVQRGDMKPCLYIGYPAFFDSSGMGSVVRNVVVTASVPHMPSVSEFTSVRTSQGSRQSLTPTSTCIVGWDPFR